MPCLPVRFPFRTAILMMLNRDLSVSLSLSFSSLDNAIHTLLLLLLSERPLGTRVSKRSLYLANRQQQQLAQQAPRHHQRRRTFSTAPDKQQKQQKQQQASTFLSLPTIGVISLSLATGYVADVSHRRKHHPVVATITSSIIITFPLASLALAATTTKTTTTATTLLR
jgi:MFS family permease